MSQESRSRGRRNGGNGGAPLPLKLGVGAAAIVLLFLLAGRTSGASHHPEPRPDVHAGHVVPGERYEGHPRVKEVYEMVAAVPMIVDGIYCYCHCSEHSGHYSLLDCFADDHGARCDVCMSEATLAFRMAEEGHDLKAIRAEIDARFGT